MEKEVNTVSIISVLGALKTFGLLLRRRLPFKYIEGLLDCDYINDELIQDLELGSILFCIIIEVVL